MRNKKAWIVLSTILVLGLLASIFGCKATPATTTAPPVPGTTAAPSPTASPAPSPKPTASPSPTTTTAPTPAQPKVIKWKSQPLFLPGPALGPFNPSGGYVTDLRYVDWVKKATGGRLEIELVPANSLFPVAETFNAVKNRIVDLATNAFGGYWAGILPEGAIESGIPFNAETLRDVNTLVYWYGLYDIMKEAYAANGIHYVALYPSQPSVIEARFAMPSPASIKGKKVRATGYDGEVITLMGGSATSVPVAEMYMAFKLGTVDGCLVNTGLLETIKLKEVTTDMLITTLKHYMNSTFINQKALDELPADIREILVRDSRYILLESETEQRSSEDYILSRAASEYGIKLYTWSEADMKLLRKQGIDTIWPKLAALSPRNAKMIEANKKFLKDFNRI